MALLTFCYWRDTVLRFRVWGFGQSWLLSLSFFVSRMGGFSTAFLLYMISLSLQLSVSLAVLMSKWNHTCQSLTPITVSCMLRRISQISQLQLHQSMFAQIPGLDFQLKGGVMHQTGLKLAADGIVSSTEHIAFAGVCVCVYPYPTSFAAHVSWTLGRRMLA